MKYTFIKLQRPQFNVRAMCRMLCVHPSGFYAWLKRPFSNRAIEDKRQIELLKDAWEENGKVSTDTESYTMIYVIKARRVVRTVWRG